MPDESSLREIARDAIQRKKLPAGRPDRITLTGAGSGAACAVCGETVNTDQMGVEIEFKRAEVAKYFFHTKCFSAWGFECERIEGVSI